ncbi:hypothetical protein [Georgenia yuyongxinii]
MGEGGEPAGVQVPREPAAERARRDDGDPAGLRGAEQRSPDEGRLAALARVLGPGLEQRVKDGGMHGRAGRDHVLRRCVGRRELLLARAHPRLADVDVPEPGQRDPDGGQLDHVPHGPW